jgi:hypothetical protein
VLIGRWAFADRPQSGEPNRAHDAVGEIIVIDGERMKEVGRLALGRMPFTTRLSPDGRTAWVSGFDTGLVSIIDLETLTVRAQLANNPNAKLGGTHGLCYIPMAAGALAG